MSLQDILVTGGQTVGRKAAKEPADESLAEFGNDQFAQLLAEDPKYEKGSAELSPEIIADSTVSLENVFNGVDTENGPQLDVDTILSPAEKPGGSGSDGLSSIIVEEMGALGDRSVPVFAGEQRKMATTELGVNASGDSASVPSPEIQSTPNTEPVVSFYQNASEMIAQALAIPQGSQSERLLDTNETVTLQNNSQSDLVKNSANVWHQLADVTGQARTKEAIVNISPPPLTSGAITTDKTLSNSMKSNTALHTSTLREGPTVPREPKAQSAAADQASPNTTKRIGIGAVSTSTSPTFALQAAFEEFTSMQSGKVEFIETLLPKDMMSSQSAMPTISNVSTNQAVPISPTAPVQQVVAQVSAIDDKASNGVIEVKLDPEELGKVRINFITREAGLLVTVSAERSETLELLRRNAEELKLGLGDMDFEGADLEFSNAPSGGEQDPEHDEASVKLAEQKTMPDLTVVAAVALPSDRLDIRL